MIAVVVGLVAVAGAGYFVGRASDADVATTPNLSSEELIPAAPAAADDQADAAATDAADETASDTTDTAETTADETEGDADTAADGGADTNTDTDGTAAGDASETDGDESVVDNSDGTVRWAVFKGDQLFLRGRVPSEAVSSEIETKAGAVVGPDNVFNEYEIDPSVPAELSSPLFVEDVVLFEFNSVEIRRPFLPILDLGTKLLTLNPNVEIVVVGRTDAEGSEAMNLDVSEKRAQGVVDYWVRNGIDPDRLSIDARGESEASELDDAETAALNRRAEFIISGLLDG